MFERLDRSFELLKASSALFLKHRGLLVFPCISTVASIFVVASFAIPLGGVQALQALSAHGRVLSFRQYMGAYLFYLVEYFVIFFFNTALVGAVLMQLDGDTPTVGDGLRMAVSKIYPLLGYAFIAATVGMILNVLRERLDFLGRIIVGLLGVGWTLATYLVVPILAWHECGPIEAITESAALFKRTWGESVIGVGGLGVAFALIYLGVIGCGALLVCFASCVLHSAVLTLVLELVMIGAVVLTALVNVTLNGIYAAALYRYASGWGGTMGFEAHTLEQAFQRKD
jgi:hypothetical protein